MDDPDSRLPAECLALIRELFTKDIVDSYDGEFGVGGYGFITNGRLYKLSFSTESAPLDFTLSSGSDCPYMEATKEAIDRLIKDMNKAHPSSNYCWSGVYDYQMGVSTQGTVLDLPDRKRFVQAELLRCKAPSSPSDGNAAWSSWSRIRQMPRKRSLRSGQVDTVTRGKGNCCEAG